MKGILKLGLMLTLALPVLLSSCSKDEIDEETLNTILLENPEAQQIWSYTYKGDVVYYVTMGCCDHFNPVYDADGNYICAPDGGLANSGDGLCSDFFDKAKSKELVWE